MEKEDARQWVVMKFGGTSVASARCWDTIAGQARRHLDAGHRVLIVVSALSGVTDLLNRLADGVSDSDAADIRVRLKEQHEGLVGALDLQPSAEYAKHWDGLRRLIDTAGPRMSDARAAGARRMAVEQYRPRRAGRSGAGHGLAGRPKSAAGSSVQHPRPGRPL